MHRGASRAGPKALDWSFGIPEASGEVNKPDKEKFPFDRWVTLSPALPN